MSSAIVRDMTQTSRGGAVLAAIAGAVVTLALWLAVTAPLAMGLLHPAPVAVPENPVAAPIPPSHPGRRTAAVLLSQAGTEVTDFLAPYAILAASGTFDVLAVARSLAPAPVNGGLGILPQLTLAAFDAAHPGGADVVVIPNVLDPDDPALLDWVRRQSKDGALVVSICEGARLLANTGLLDGREATTHFAAIGALRERHPEVRWRDDRRWVGDDAFLTSAGVTAAIDASLHLVARLAGEDAASRAATALGVLRVTGDVASPPELSAADLAVGAANGALVWPKRRVLVRLEDGVDEIELAAALDAYPRTFAAASASTSPARRLVRSRHGLVLVPAQAEGPPAPDDIVVTPAGGTSDDPAFDRVLRAVARQFGGRTAALVADQLQYPTADLHLEESPTPVAGWLVRLALLVASGAGLGLAVRAGLGRRLRASAYPPG